MQWRLSSWIRGKTMQCLYDRLWFLFNFSYFVSGHLLMNMYIVLNFYIFFFIILPAVTWLKYYRYGVKHWLMNHSITFILQLARTDILVQTVQVFVPRTAGHVIPLTVHVAVMLAGRDQTVVLVFVLNSWYNSTIKTIYSIYYLFLYLKILVNYLSL